MRSRSPSGTVDSLVVEFVNELITATVSQRDELTALSAWPGLGRLKLRAGAFLDLRKRDYSLLLDSITPPPRQISPS